MPTPLPIRPEHGTLVLFGGTFDPPHRAHLSFARCVVESIPECVLLMVPARRSPHKSAAPGASGVQRAAMIEIGLRDIGVDPGRAAVWTDELDRRGPSYWVQTLRRARALLPSAVQLRFVIGSDQLASLHRWREPHEILKLAAPIVLLRPRESDSGPALLDEGAIRAHLAALGAWSACEIELLLRGLLPGQELQAVSATQVRAQLARGDDGLDAHLTAGVRAYIRAHKLYQTGR